LKDLQDPGPCKSFKIFCAALLVVTRGRTDASVTDRERQAGPSRGAGATVIREDDSLGRPDHIVMADPEGNEFDLL
jgi:hypothetical protein